VIATIVVLCHSVEMHFVTVNIIIVDGRKDGVNWRGQGTCTQCLPDGISDVDAETYKYSWY